MTALAPRSELRPAAPREAIATAHPNIALAKYWGKLAGDDNLPAVPSLSVTLDGMRTCTRVSFRDDLADDRLVLDGEEVRDRALARVVALLDRVRAATGEGARADVRTRNDFPTASGLASSASGFAALATAALGAARKHGHGPSIADGELACDLARRSSVSAARSVLGGFVELAAGTAEGNLLPRSVPVSSAFESEFRVLVVVTSEAKKAVPSSDGMRISAETSPYYTAWLSEAPRLSAELRAALVRGDFTRTGELAEASALAMHACAVAAGVVYWTGTTIEAMAAVRLLRARGTPAYFTIDAGPHVKVLTRESDAALAGTWLRAVPGVLRVIVARPGKGAELAAKEDVAL